MRKYILVLFALAAFATACTEKEQPQPPGKDLRIIGVWDFEKINHPSGNVTQIGEVWEFTKDSLIRPDTVMSYKANGTTLTIGTDQYNYNMPSNNDLNIIHQSGNVFVLNR